jgi:hypothetical protein
MKQNHRLRWPLIGRLFIVYIFLITASKIGAGDNNSASYAITPEDVLDSANISAASIKEHGDAGAYVKWESVSDKWDAERGSVIKELINIFKDSKSYPINRSAAAYYLAEMRVPEAVDVLAADITLQFEFVPPPGNLNGFRMKWHGYVAMEALIKIGNPSIPAVIRNLAKSDDAKVRELSLQVLTRVDGDKDIVQLRLQKVLKAEKDSQKQARLQVALKSLPTVQ